VKTAFVTGATGTIGGHLVRRLVDHWTITGTYHQNEGQAAILSDLGVLMIPFSTDPMPWPELDVTYDLVVIAHGHPPVISPFRDIEWTAARGILETDLMATMELLHNLIPRINPGGSIVVISSIHAVSSYPHRVAYGTAKTALVGMVRALGVELAEHGITVNAICPGQVAGPRTQSIGASDTLEQMKRRSPSGKLVDPDDIASTALWLARTRSVNAQTIVIDHGVTASSYYGDYSIHND
jgi:NAD(P)-dependent dehydrogenase (short-subunit alcohol dehydrogenase family)